MMELATAFTRLVGCRVPIQNVGIPELVTVELAAAIAEAGALGMVSGSFLNDNAMGDLLERLKQRTEGAVGVNFLAPFLDAPGALAAVDVAARRAKVVEFFYAEPDPALIRRVHAGGALAAWQVGSAREAQSAANAGCDFVVVQGVEAGGHIRGTVGLWSILPQVLDEVRIPVLAAGGMATGRAIAAALTAGAAGVRIGTRFVAAAESNAHSDYVDRLVAAGAEDTRVTEAFSVMWPNAPHRVLGSAVDAVHTLSGETVGEVDFAGQRVPVPRLSVLPPSRNATGRVDAMALYAGESVSAIRGVEPAATIIESLMADTIERLSAPAREAR
jgi:NAD(P)H-dependent flavin oxidoreductase YrpB (nitropropane dioxygenase family)